MSDTIMVIKTYINIHNVFIYTFMCVFIIEYSKGNKRKTLTLMEYFDHILV